jgi:hypothetical protein
VIERLCGWVHHLGKDENRNNNRQVEEGANKLPKEYATREPAADAKPKILLISMLINILNKQ